MKTTIVAGRASTGWVYRLAVICVLVCASSACAQQKQGDDRTPTPGRATTTDSASLAEGNELVRAIGGIFHERNPKLSTVGVLELRSWDFLGPRVVIGWSIVGDRVFRGDFKDEMFGVFVVNESLTRVERVLDVFPTPRWFDYQLNVGRFTGDSVEVVGSGATYGDGPMRKAYKWR